VERHVYMPVVIPVGYQCSDKFTSPLLF
jgi:hypothetical protein